MRDIVLVDRLVIARMVPMVIARRAQHVFERPQIPANVGVDQPGLEAGKDDVNGERLLGDAEDEGGNQHQGAHHERFEKM